MFMRVTPISRRMGENVSLEIQNIEITSSLDAYSLQKPEHIFYQEQLKKK